MMAVSFRPLSIIAIFTTILSASLASADGSSPEAEDAFLDVLAQIDVPETVEPIAGAVNKEFRHCQAFWPPEYGQAQTGHEARALRDIYSYVRGRNVIQSKDCGCAGKVANWADVEAIAAFFRKEHQVGRLSWQHTRQISSEAHHLIATAEAMCGGRF